MSDTGTVARHIMIGGFLGAGKTTALAALAKRLVDRGLRVGLITNDQSHGLVDTGILRKRGFAVEEITGGCFCCRFPSLKDAADRLSETEKPDVFLAEPVGSCTDLVATVSYPLRRIFGDRFSVAPLSVLLDPLRAARMLGLRKGRAFSDKVRYVFEKQLEEAHVLVLNKIDTVDESLRDEILAALDERHPGARRFSVSAARGDGLDEWFSYIETAELPRGPAMAIDYDAYAEGEARLGWLNATFRVRAAEPIDGDAWLHAAASDLRDRLRRDGVEIAHLKLTLDPGDPTAALAAASVVGSESEVEVREALREPIDDASLVVNLRAEADPDALLAALEATLFARRGALSIEREHVERFRPARPVPTHRDQEPA